MAAYQHPAKHTHRVSGVSTFHSRRLASTKEDTIAASLLVKPHCAAHRCISYMPHAPPRSLSHLLVMGASLLQLLTTGTSQGHWLCGGLLGRCGLGCGRAGQGCCGEAAGGGCGAKAARSAARGAQDTGCMRRTFCQERGPGSINKSMESLWELGSPPMPARTLTGVSQ